MDEKDKLSIWMKDILSKNRWKAEDWARLADTSPTNITRFLSKGTHMPSSRVLDALADAANSVPPLGPKPGVVVQSIPFRRGGKMSDERFHTVTELSSKAFAVTLETDSMSLGGMLPGDILICEPEDVVIPRHGLIVVFEDEKNGLEGDPVLSAGKYYPPYIMPASSNSEHKPVPTDNCAITGVVVQQTRDFSSVI